MSIINFFSDILINFGNPPLIDEGGQKAVFKFHDKERGNCALKVGKYSNHISLERIQREVNTLQKIDSPYYPKVYDFSIIDESRFLILEEFIEGDPLSKRIDDFSNTDQTLDLLINLVKGLTVIWDMSIVHRDIKPDNIIIQNDRSIKIIDLGIARILDDVSLTWTLAQRGPATPIYAAPEQLQNRKKEIDFRTDQFNLGIIFVQLLLHGDHPFDQKHIGNNNQIEENIIAGNWCRPYFISLGYESFLPLVDKLLGKEPYMRFRTPSMLLSSISQFIGRKNDH